MDNPHFLYLRSFDEDRLKVVAPSLRRGILARLVPLRRRRFEEVLVEALAPYGPVVAVSPPGTRLAPLGTARTLMPQEGWLEEVRRLAQGAMAVVLSATPGQVRGGLEEELRLLGAGGLSQARVMILRAPWRGMQQQQRWTTFVRAASRHDFFKPLGGDWVQPGAHVVAHRESDGWTAWGARQRTDRSYLTAVREAVDHCWAEWRDSWSRLNNESKG